ncbi:SGNH/GDSL hydrolase family protein [Parabacteroides chinchillae]
MKKLIVSAICLLSATLISAQTPEYKDWANFGKFTKANTTVEKPVAVFMGNSITEGWWNNNQDFFTSNNYANRGIGGQVTSQMLVRFRPDVINLHPKVVVILAGINDIAYNDYAVPLKNTFENIASMADLAQANNIKVILCSTLPAYEFPWRPGVKPAPLVKELNNMIKDYADKTGAIYLDYYTAMVDERGGLSAENASDGVHPTTKGYKIMEPMVKAAIEKALK